MPYLYLKNPEDFFFVNNMFQKLRCDAERQECDWDFKTTHAMSVHNFTKNRYRDVLPC